MEKIMKNKVKLKHDFFGLSKGDIMTEENEEYVYRSCYGYEDIEYKVSIKNFEVEKHPKYFEKMENK